MDSAIADIPPLSRSSPVSVAVDPVALVVTECITVTSAMRKHARWAHSSVSAILGGSAPPSQLEGLKPPLSRRLSSSKEANGTLAPPQSKGVDEGLAGRWGLRGKKGQSMQDNPLLSAFARLRNDLKLCKDIRAFDAPSILHPFLQVIRSSSTSAPITSLALIAITKFFSYGIISRESPQLPLAMQLLSSAVTHCRFEASDSATDEIVLFRILKLMEGMVTGHGGEVLGDESMCEMMETGISMCCQVRLSELLRRSAEVSMVTMCQTIFQRLKIIDVEPERSMRRGSSKTEGDAVRLEPTMDPTINGDLLSPVTEEKMETEEAAGREINEKDSSETPRESPSMDQSRNQDESTGGADLASSSQLDLSKAAEKDKHQDIKPYGLPSIKELFRVLVGLLDPHDKQQNDTMRVMALRIVDVALEVAGPSIANHPSLASMAKDTLCRHLFQLVRSENVVILNESLRVAGTLLSSCRRVLKLQQELFLSYLVGCLHPKVEIPQEAGIDSALYEGVPQAPRLAKGAPSQTSSGRSTPVPIKDRQKLGMEGGSRKPDAREAMVESVGALVRIPSFMVELFVNYDCEIDRGDLCIDMVGLLSRNAFPDAATWSTTNVPPLCLDALLGYVNSLAERLDEESMFEGYPPLKQLRDQRAMKKIIIKGATKFNESPKAGLAFLTSQGIIDDVENPTSVAQFLRGTTRVDKKVLGDFLSKREHSALLTAFMETFDFEDLRVDEALRELLNSFRLPGEAPLIERVVNEFSSKYFSSADCSNIADKDALYVLTYAIIMLNTDQHNPNVKSKNRMSFEDFARNLRGVNGEKDFDQEYLQDIYDSIKTREIILPEEHDNRHSFDHAWKELLFKIQSTSDLKICDTNIFDQDMFAATWKPVVATLSYVFMSATDDTVFSRVVTGFDQCALIAAKYQLHEALDHIIFCLSSISTLATPTIPSTALNTEVQHGERRVMVSETAVRFGRDFKAQLATVVLFRVVVGHEAAIRDGWNQLVKIILNLFCNSLLSNAYETISSHDDLPSIPPQSPAQIIDREKTNDSGIFSAFTSYVSSFANDEPPEPSDQEIEYTLCTIDCINACSFESFFSNISALPIEAMKIFVETLMRHLPEDSTPKVMVVKGDMPAPTPIRPNGSKAKSVGLAYDSSVVFILEFATILAARDLNTINSLGKEIAAALQSVVRDASHMHPVTLSRAVYYLLSFLRASHDHDFVRVPVVLHAISKFDTELLKQSSSSIVMGLLLCLSETSGLRREMVNSPDFWLVLRGLQNVAAGDVFAIVQDVVEGSPPALTADNFEPICSILNDFATAGSSGAVAEQRREQMAARTKTAAKKEQSSDVVVRGTKAIQVLYQITGRVPGLVTGSQLEPKAAWNSYWNPPFRILTTHSLNPCRQIRGQALSSLQRVLLSPSLGISASNTNSANFSTTNTNTIDPDNPDVLNFQRTTSLFTDIIFQLIGQLLKPEIWSSDPAGMGETRLQAAVMCCKVFVRYLDVLFGSEMGHILNVQSEGQKNSAGRETGLMSPTAEKTEASSMVGALTQPQQSQGNESTTGSMPPNPEKSQTSKEQQSQQQLPQIDGIRLWSHILQVLERLMKSGGSSSQSSSQQQSTTDANATSTNLLEEALPESLKNIVLVMSSDGYLRPPRGKLESDDTQASERSAQEKRLWKVTWVRLERFLPGLMEGLFPGAGRETPPRARSPPPQSATANEDERSSDEGDEEEEARQTLPGADGNAEKGEEKGGEEEKNEKETNEKPEDEESQASTSSNSTLD